ncbi:cupredoxin domain-containing protein [Ilumatobacter coccineus]|uniref:EfeO-type cupredoxin-like domain-containing protein n=1 Tax=Ilumatobacter coccineus (strain NBRC 103263 / KCTC 29153 / YM16-304) TaxID=1313172 RepID=A0A6C7E2I9_ILUCY|nr:cupredoxin domain-containing protein [Ilumatobacter coccineus]BAN01021.1 hypothetical protein YM304_07070 [Ilumatobacter coccineus YM16-304]
MRNLGHRLALILLPIAVIGASAGCGGSESGGASGPPRTVSLEAVEYRFQADEAITIRAGDTIEFEVRNGGDLEHQMEVWDANNRVLGMTERIPPGAVRSVTVTFDDAGAYRVVCDIDDHLIQGQQAGFDVFDAND